MASEADRQLVQGALARYREPLLRFAASLVGPSHAPDVVQDTFLALCKASRQEVEAHLAPWLFRVCKNRALDLRREQARLQDISDDEESPESGPSSSVEKKQSLSRVQSIVEKLPVHQKQAMLLKFSGGLSYKEIAEVMELSVGNVGFILHTAIQKVREQLAAADAEPVDVRSAL
jgi:RNA polymerase sigma factor (sigma-70 family)